MNALHLVTLHRSKQLDQNWCGHGEVKFRFAHRITKNSEKAIFKQHQLKLRDIYSKRCGMSLAVWQKLTYRLMFLLLCIFFFLILNSLNGTEVWKINRISNTNFQQNYLFHTHKSVCFFFSTNKQKKNTTKTKFNINGRRRVVLISATDHSSPSQYNWNTYACSMIEL